VHIDEEESLLGAAKPGILYYFVLVLLCSKEIRCDLLDDDNFVGSEKMYTFYGYK